jgi:hypothetical protein
VRVVRGFAIGAGLLLVLAFLFVWFALPPILGGVAVGLLRDAGLQAADMRVDVQADPPLRLIGLHADRVRVRASDVEIETLRAESVDVTLRDVSLREETFGVIEGRIDGARLTPAEGPVVQVTSVQISGPPERALMTMSLSEEDVASLVRSTIARSFGSEADNVDLEAPDRLTFDVSGQPVAGRLRVDEDGSLVFREDRGALTLDLFRSSPDDAAVLRSARVVDDETLEVTGTLDVRAAR